MWACGKMRPMVKVTIPHVLNLSAIHCRSCRVRFQRPGMSPDQRQVINSERGLIIPKYWNNLY